MHRNVRPLVLAGITSALVAATVAIAAPALASPGNGNSGNGNSGSHAKTHASSVLSAKPSASAVSSLGADAGTSGDTTAPQPPSNADFSGNGANVHGPYDSTRDGSPSGNGNGNGKAVGKPCAGCVGKADNKNPAGQMPGGSDPNSGYECDRNHGVGRSNPAHTSCTSAPPTSTPPTSEAPTSAPPVTSGPPTSEPPTSAPPVTSEPPTSEPPTNNPPSIAIDPPPPSVAIDVPGSPQTPPAATSDRPLANTGAPARPVLLAGLASLLAGTGLMFAARRRPAAGRRH